MDSYKAIHNVVCQLRNKQESLGSIYRAELLRIDEFIATLRGMLPESDEANGSIDLVDGKYRGQTLKGGIAGDVDGDPEFVGTRGRNIDSDAVRKLMPDNPESAISRRRLLLLCQNNGLRACTASLFNWLQNEMDEGRVSVVEGKYYRAATPATFKFVDSTVKATKGRILFADGTNESPATINWDVEYWHTIFKLIPTTPPGVSLFELLVTLQNTHKNVDRDALLHWLHQWHSAGELTRKVHGQDFKYYRADEGDHSAVKEAAPQAVDGIAVGKTFTIIDAEWDKVRLYIPYDPPGITCEKLLVACLANDIDTDIETLKVWMNAAVADEKMFMHTPGMFHLRSSAKRPDPDGIDWDGIRGLLPSVDETGIGWEDFKEECERHGYNVNPVALGSWIGKEISKGKAASFNDGYHRID